MLTRGKAERVLDAIIDDVTGDSIGMFLEWHDVSEDDYDETVNALHELLDQIPDDEQ